MFRTSQFRFGRIGTGFENDFDIVKPVRAANPARPDLFLDDTHWS
jgi:hypothetical protein